MSTAITLAGPEQLSILLGLVERRATEAGGPAWDDADQARATRAIDPLLSGGELGAAWLIGPTRAPLGYAILTFGWSLNLGGREAWVEDLYIRPSVRRRGIGTEVLHAIAVSLRRADVKALQARVPAQDGVQSGFLTGAGFAIDHRLALMTDLL